MEENEEEWKPMRYKIIFNIDVPQNLEDSIFNSIIIGIHEYKYMRNNGEIEDKEKNNLLMKIQEELDQLMIPEQ